MPSAIARVTPTDYDAWYALHIRVVREHAASSGIISEVLYKDHDDPRTVVLVQDIESVEKFQRFLASDVFQEIVAQAPIEGPPTFWFVDEHERIDVSNL